jgi:predicted amidohydrolase YtcJ
VAFASRSPESYRNPVSPEVSGLKLNNQIPPFNTLYFAVTGKMVGGTKVIRQTISREDALIAHTRKNAFSVFQENNLGAIQAGKLADLVVMDRDYLTIPAEQIKDIKPLITMVGGKIAYDANAEEKTSRASVATH